MIHSIEYSLIDRFTDVLMDLGLVEPFVAGMLNVTLYKNFKGYEYE